MFHSFLSDFQPYSYTVKLRGSTGLKYPAKCREKLSRPMMAGLKRLANNLAEVSASRPEGRCQGSWVTSKRVNKGKQGHCTMHIKSIHDFQLILTEKGICSSSYPKQGRGESLLVVFVKGRAIQGDRLQWDSLKCGSWLA